jgi:uncharacterized protein (TIGR00369 family)
MDTRPDPETASIVEAMQAEILSREDGKATIRFPVLPHFTIPGGQLQGGIYGVMMDMAMATAANGGLATVSLQTNILRPVFEGKLTVTGKVLHKGRRILYAEAEIRDGQSRVVARGSQTAVPLDPVAPGSGRTRAS